LQRRVVEQKRQHVFLRFGRKTLLAHRFFQSQATLLLDELRRVNVTLHVAAGGQADVVARVLDCVVFNDYGRSIALDKRRVNVNQIFMVRQQSIKFSTVSMPYFAMCRRNAIAVDSPSRPSFCDWWARTCSCA
jgi:hypothetical protein